MVALKSYFILVLRCLQIKFFILTFKVSFSGESLVLLQDTHSTVAGSISPALAFEEWLEFAKQDMIMPRRIHSKY